MTLRCNQWCSRAWADVDDVRKTPHNLFDMVDASILASSIMTVLFTFMTLQNIFNHNSREKIFFSETRRKFINFPKFENL